MNQQTPKSHKAKKIVVGATLLLMAATHALDAQAAELLVWSAGAAQAPMTALVKDYIHDSGNRVQIEFAPVGSLLKRLSEGGKPDVLILSQDVASEVERSGWTAPRNSILKIRIWFLWLWAMAGCERISPPESPVAV